MHALPTSLLAAIEGNYAAFARYPLPSRDDYSPLAGISEQDSQRLRSRPLRAIDGKDLARYTRAALATWGDAAQLKHFLPRILELVAMRDAAIDPMLALEKLAAAKWGAWPIEERAAISAYLREIWAHALSAGPDEIGIGPLLRGIALVEPHVNAYVEQWRDERGYNATRQIAYLVTLYAPQLQSHGGLSTRLPPSANKIVMGFLLEPATAERLEAAFLSHPDGDEGRELAEAVDVLAAARALARA